MLNGFRVTSATHINEVKVLTRALTAQRYGTGSPSTHAYYVTKWHSTYTKINIKVHTEKWRLCEVIIF